MAKLYHIFFISQKQTFNIGGTDYSAWVVTVNSNDYYFMEKNDPRPSGYTVRNIVGVLASAGANDLLYFVTPNQTVASIATQSSEYAGGSDLSTAAAYLTFAILSFHGKSAHSQIPIGSAARLGIKCEWQGGSGTVQDWIDAGYPTTNFQAKPTIEVLGVK